VITFMIGRRAPKGEKWAQIRKKDVEVRLHAWKRLVNAIDPTWDANDVPLVNVMPPLAAGPPGGVAPGVAPEAIKDPKLRAQYEAAIEKNRLSLLLMPQILTTVRQLWMRYLSTKTRKETG